jgi:DNA-binding XRE family transcriptional regulator
MRKSFTSALDFPDIPPRIAPMNKDQLLAMDEPDRYQTMRRMLGLTGAELAAILEVSRETISNRERGKTPITGEAWLALDGLKLFADLTGSRSSDLTATSGFALDA